MKQTFSGDGRLYDTDCSSNNDRSYIFSDPRQTKGFTVAELLIVVAIIGILSMISIPIFSGKLEEARDATCEANLATVTRVVRTEVMTGMAEKEGMVNLLSHTLGATNVIPQIGGWYKCEGLCPSGGIYRVVTDAYGNIHVTCSKHGGTATDTLIAEHEMTLNTLVSLEDYFLKYYETRGAGTSIDSQGPNWGMPIKDELAKALGVTTDFDFRIYCQSGNTTSSDGTYRVYISDPLHGYADRADLQVTGLEFKLIGGRIQGIKKGTQQTCSVVIKQVDGKDFYTINASQYKW